MHADILKRLEYFRRINAPKYIEAKIQKIAFAHLNVSDMGKLRDRFDGQLYYDKLKTDIIAEYSFENLIGNKSFDWTKRELKNHKRKLYTFNGKVLRLVTITKARLPRISIEHITNTLFVYVNIDNRVYISGLATKTFLESYTTDNKIFEFKDFEKLLDFDSLEFLINNLD